jgi:hypothetical protein
METKFKGTTEDIKLEDVIMLDANGNPIGSKAAEGAVTNPVMNPVYAAMYTPYISSYNYLMQNPNAYYATIPQGTFLVFSTGNISHTIPNRKCEFIIGRISTDAKEK